MLMLLAPQPLLRLRLLEVCQQLFDLTTSASELVNVDRIWTDVTA